MVSEKRYFRSDNVLGTVDSATETFTAEGVGNNDSFDIGIRVFVDAVEVTAGSPVGIANCPKGVTAHVTVTSTWNKVSNDAMSGSKVHVDVYGKLHSDADWTPERYFETEVLVGTQLDAALWSISYHVERIKNSNVSYSYEFAFGESNSWINNFTYSTPGSLVMPVPMHHYSQMTKIHRG